MINKNILKTIPKAPGVYVFKTDNIYLYIGKSKSLKDRVRTHLNSKNNKSAKFVREASDFFWIETAGELGAEIREARMIKKLRPIYNRKLRRKRTLVRIRLIENSDGYLVPKVMDNNLENLNIDKMSNDMIFDSIRIYKKLLNKIVDDYGICPIVLGLEKGDRCFMRMLGKCEGACDGNHEVREFNEIIMNFFERYRVSFWDFGDSIKFSEQKDSLSETFEIENWRIKSIESNIENKIDLNLPTSFDEYKIIRHYVGQLKVDSGK